MYFVFLIILGAVGYVTYTLNLWGPMLRMTNAASSQAVEIGKEKLRDFLESSDGSRQAVGMRARQDSGGISLNTLDSSGKRKSALEDDDDDI